MTGALITAFPMPTSTELEKAYTDLFLAANGDEATKKRIGNPALLPRPWDPPTCTRPTLRHELWQWLDTVVTWFNHEYVWDHNAGTIPPCWPQHPHLVHDIAVLADQRRRAALDLTSTTLEEWHRVSVPAFLDRLKTRTKNTCDERHSTWPAHGRHTRHNNTAAERAELFGGDLNDLATRTQPQARPGENRAKLHLVDTDSGRPIDPVSGEVL